jgi:hypothetical protein
MKGRHGGLGGVVPLNRREGPHFPLESVIFQADLSLVRLGKIENAEKRLIRREYPPILPVTHIFPIQLRHI